MTVALALAPAWLSGGRKAGARNPLAMGLKGGVCAAAAGPALAASPEEQLIAAARAGSPEAFSHLVQRHQQAVRAFLRRASGDAALADDLAQETFLAAWRGIGRFDGRSSFRSWLCGVAYRKHLGQRRSGLRALARDTDWAEAQAAALHPAAGTGQENRLALQSAMAALPPEQRAAVALCLAADFSHAEAAAALGLPLGTVKSHVTRGRQKLLDHLGADHV